MNAITRYILNQLALGMVLVTAGLTAVIWLTQSLKFVEMIVNRGLSTGSFVYLTALLLPNFLSVILPIALFAVVTFVYTRMITDREMVVMNAVGLSRLAVAWPAIALALIVAGLGYALNAYFLPQSYQRFREFQWEIRYGYSHVILQEGTFSSISNHVTVYVRERTREGELTGVLIHDSRDKDKPATLMAERGAMVQTPEGARIITFNGSRQVLERKVNRMSILYFDRYTIDLESTREAAPDRYREPRERMIGELFDIAADKNVEAKDYGKFIVEGHQRLITPWNGLSYALIALACLLSGDFSRRGQNHRIALAVMAVIALQGLSLGFANAGAKNSAWVPLIYLNTLIPGLIATHVLAFGLPRRRPPKTAPAGELA